MSPVPIPERSRIPMGRDRDEYGRTERHPAAPRLRDKAMPAKGRNAEPLSITVQNEHERRQMQHGVIMARVDFERPPWAEGDVVTVARLWRVTGKGRNETHRQDSPLALEIDTVAEIHLRDIDDAVLRKMGHPRRSAFAAAIYGAGHPARLLERLAADGTVVWVTTWQPNNDLHPRWLAGGVVRQGGQAYVETPLRALPKAGTAVPEPYQRELSEAANIGVLLGTLNGQATGSSGRVGQLRKHGRRGRR